MRTLSELYVLFVLQRTMKMSKVSR